MLVFTLYFIVIKKSAVDVFYVIFKSTFFQGHYLFIEASTGVGDALRKRGFRARLFSPLIRVPEVCLTFFYHMLGSHIGSLSVYKRSNAEEKLVWKRSTEDMGDMWHKGEVHIANPIAFEVSYFVNWAIPMQL